MIPLLTPEAVKTGSSRQETEQRNRVRDLSNEENRLIGSVNILRTNEAEERERIEGDMAKFRAEQRTERDRLSNEVTTLESRRTEAMKPIEQVQKETDERNAASLSRETAVATREDAADSREKSLGERETEFLETSADRQQVVGEREKALDDREERVRQEEAISKESLDGLNLRWADFHKLVAETDRDLVRRENAAVAAEQANVARAGELDKRELDYQSKDREIADRYATLTASSLEIDERMRSVAEREAALLITQQHGTN